MDHVVHSLFILSARRFAHLCLVDRARAAAVSSAPRTWPGISSRGYNTGSESAKPEAISQITWSEAPFEAEPR